MEMLEYVEKLATNSIFPMICCWLLYRENRDQRKDHAQESDTLKQCFMEISVAITRLVDKFDMLMGIKGGIRDDG